MQLDVASRNAILNALETTWGTDAILRIRTGAAPANLAAASSGTVLIEITLPTDYLANASSGTKALAGTWQGTVTADGTAGHYEIVSSDGTTRRAQGSVGLVGVSGELRLLSLSLVTDTVIPITSALFTAGNA